MSDRLTDKEVMHVANLAKINISSEEIDKYAKDLKILLDEIEKIRDIEITTDDLLVTPVEHESILRDDNDTSSVDFNDIKKNIPAITGNFVEVPVMVNE